MAQLDNIIHQPVRLQIMSSLISLDQNEQVNFTYRKNIRRPQTLHFYHRNGKGPGCF